MKRGSFRDLSFFRTEKQLRDKWGGSVGKIKKSDRPQARYLLTLWGMHYRGDEAPGDCGINIIGKLMLRDEWDDETATLIRVTIGNCKKQGYSGNELLEKVKEIVSPNKSTLGALRLAKEKDDADVVESCINKAFPLNNPLRDVVIKRYKNRKSPQNVLESLSRETGIDIDSAKRRVRWADTIIEDVIYSTVIGNQ